MGLPDEASVYADAALAAVEKSVIYVPELWLYEIANGLAISYRRQRITADDERAFLAALSQLAIRLERTDGVATIRQGTAAAIRFGLTAYDAVYVDLALREKLPLATLDERMQKAAIEAGVSLFKP